MLQVVDDIDGEYSYDQPVCYVAIYRDGNNSAVVAYGNYGNGSWYGKVRVHVNICNSWVKVCLAYALSSK